MLFECTYQIQPTAIIGDKRLAIFQAKKMLPEYVFDTSQLENNPITFPEVKTLMDGITIGGHRISDVQQVLNIKESWLLLLQRISQGTFRVDKAMFHEIHGRIAREEALEWGKFRTGSVSIAGTSTYASPAWQDLELIFERELPQIMIGENPIEQAVRLFLWAALNLFYWDGNKRTARLMATGILINAGLGVFNIRTADILTFNKLMVDFYETKEVSAIAEFLATKCVRFAAE